MYISTSNWQVFLNGPIQFCVGQPSESVAAIAGICRCSFLFQAWAALRHPWMYCLASFYFIQSHTASYSQHWCLWLGKNPKDKSGAKQNISLRCPGCFICPKFGVSSCQMLLETWHSFSFSVARLCHASQPLYWYQILIYKCLEGDKSTTATASSLGIPSF